MAGVAGPEVGNELTVSVIIPAYRSAETLGRALESVLQQTCPASEILVVDDGSPDDLAPLVEGYGARVTLLRKPNGGAASARNYGIEHSQGGLLAFLDADDYWEPQKLQRHLGLYRQNPGLGLSFSQFFEQEPGRERVLSGRFKGGRGLDGMIQLSGRRAFEWATRISTITVVVPRRVLGDERFDTSLATAEDRDLWARLVQVAPVYGLAEPLATAVLEKGSLSRTNAERDCTSMLRVVERHRNLLGPLGVRCWRSQVLYRWAALDECPRSALPRLLQSLALWPFPYRWRQGGQRLGRLKRLFVLLRISLRGTAMPRGGKNADGV